MENSEYEDDDIRNEVKNENELNLGSTTSALVDSAVTKSLSLAKEEAQTPDLTISSQLSEKDTNLSEPNTTIENSEYEDDDHDQDRQQNPTEESTISNEEKENDDQVFETTNPPSTTSIPEVVTDVVQVVQYETTLQTETDNTKSTTENPTANLSLVSNEEAQIATISLVTDQAEIAAENDIDDDETTVSPETSTHSVAKKQLVHTNNDVDETPAPESFTETTIIPTPQENVENEIEDTTWIKQSRNLDDKDLNEHNLSTSERQENDEKQGNGEIQPMNTSNKTNSSEESEESIESKEIMEKKPDVPSEKKDSSSEESSEEYEHSLATTAADLELNLSSAKGSRSVNAVVSETNSAASSLVGRHPPSNSLKDKLGAESNVDQEQLTSSLFSTSRSSLFIGMSLGIALLIVVKTMAIYFVKYRRHQGTLDIELQEQRCGKDDLDEERTETCIKLLQKDLPAPTVSTALNIEGEPDECL